MSSTLPVSSIQWDRVGSRLKTKKLIGWYLVICQASYSYQYLVDRVLTGTLMLFQAVREQWCHVQSPGIKPWWQRSPIQKAIIDILDICHSTKTLCSTLQFLIKLLGSKALYIRTNRESPSRNHNSFVSADNLPHSLRGKQKYWRVQRPLTSRFSVMSRTRSWWILKVVS